MMQNRWFFLTKNGRMTIIAMPKQMAFLSFLFTPQSTSACSSGLRLLYMLRYSSQSQCPSCAFLPIFLEKPWKDLAELYCFLMLASERTLYASLISLNLPSFPGLESGWQDLASRQYDFLISLSLESLVTYRMLQQSLEGSNLGTQLQMWKRLRRTRLFICGWLSALKYFPNIIIIELKCGQYSPRNAGRLWNWGKALLLKIHEWWLFQSLPFCGPQAQFQCEFGLRIVLLFDCRKVKKIIQTIS